MNLSILHYFVLKKKEKTLLITIVSSHTHTFIHASNSKKDEQNNNQTTSLHKTKPMIRVSQQMILTFSLLVVDLFFSLVLCVHILLIDFVVQEKKNERIPVDLWFFIDQCVDSVLMCIFFLSGHLLC